MIYLLWSFIKVFVIITALFVIGFLILEKIIEWAETPSGKNFFLFKYFKRTKEEIELKSYKEIIEELEKEKEEKRI